MKKLLCKKLQSKKEGIENSGKVKVSNKTALSTTNQCIYYCSLIRLNLTLPLNVFLSSFFTNLIFFLPLRCVQLVR